MKPSIVFQDTTDLGCSKEGFLLLHGSGKQRHVARRDFRRSLSRIATKHGPFSEGIERALRGYISNATHLRVRGSAHPRDSVIESGGAHEFETNASE